MTNTALPQPIPAERPELVVTDGGLETWLQFQNGIELPAFAAYPLAGTTAGRALLDDYYGRYVAIAERHGVTALLETPTWRANPDWAQTLGHGRDELGRMIDAAVDLLVARRDARTTSRPLVVSGNVGPRGDGYRADRRMSVDEAAAYHELQIRRMAAGGVDLVSALTMVDVHEAAGFALAASAAGVDCVVSFTVETDGRLPSGTSLGDAIDQTDRLSGSAPRHYMVNCAHPTHFADTVRDDQPWVHRIGGIRANASSLSHAELDVLEHLDDGDPADLAAHHLDLRRHLPAAHVLGGCCGTDERHVAAIADAWIANLPTDHHSTNEEQQ